MKKSSLSLFVPADIKNSLIKNKQEFSLPLRIIMSYLLLHNSILSKTLFKKGKIGKKANKNNDCSTMYEVFMLHFISKFFKKGGVQGSLAHLIIAVEVVADHGTRTE